MWQPVAKPYTHTKFQSNWISTSRDMAKYVIFKPPLRKKGKWRENKMAALAGKGSQWPKQLVLLSWKMRKKGDYNKKSQF